MAKYIECEAVKKSISECFGDITEKDAEYIIANVPENDVVEVKRGYWKDKFNRNRIATQSFCSVCGKHSGIGGIESNRHKPYCPNCGAKMDAERKCDE
jgi:hypothetical protein